VRPFARSCLLVLALALAGCGVGESDSASSEEVVRLKITRDFGGQTLGNEEGTAGGTVMRLLQGSFHTETSDGGGFVQAIEGVAGGRRNGRPVDWFYYVNGMEAGVGAAEFELSPGDRVWWDHHDWGGAMRIPAIVGSFPEPFLTGVEGKRLPTTMTCIPADARACEEVGRRLEEAGIDRVARAAPGAQGGPELLRVLVGPWAQLRTQATVRQIERGPRASGVFARPDATGAKLTIYDQRGDAARTLGAGAGLVAAVRYGEDAPTWVITGTDTAGVEAAAAALSPETLGNRFALAVEDGRPIGLPVRPAGASTP
jgi:hypothetical protein